MSKKQMSRREFLRLSAVTAAGLALARGAPTATPTAAAGRTIKIGYVSPQTGPLAGFGEADNFILSGVQQVFADGLSAGGAKHPVEILVKDSQSDPNRATEAAADLIL